MIKYRVQYVRIPTAYSPRQVVFISALSEEDANRLWRHYVETSTGISAGQYLVEDISPCNPLPVGVIHP